MVYLVRMEIGEMAMEVLKKFVREKKIKSGVFWAIGSVGG